LPRSQLGVARNGEGTGRSERARGYLPRVPRLSALTKLAPPAALLVGLVILWPRPEPTAPPRRPVSAEAEFHVQYTPEQAVFALPFLQEGAAVQASCDLDLAVACEGGGCAALVVAPDLDGVGGWVQLAVTSPRFVLSTLARDLGVPASGLPCGSAVARLVEDRPITSVELADGTELWCTVTGERAAGLAWCRAEAARRLGVEVAFDRPGLRELTFDRSRR
jgi:hypothetical protein